MVRLLLLLLTTCLCVIHGLENGLARTPPMGWLSWQRFRCIIDCNEYPDECISEKLFKDIADVMASDGFKEAGYEYVIIDDCWLADERDNNGKLQANAERFPSGIKALAAYIHSKGLKFGIYEDYGTHTCAGYPGSMDNMAIDAKTFADWDVDYVKLDGCFAELDELPGGFAEFSEHMNATGREMVFSCCYPLYEESKGHFTDYAKAAKTCNLWRNHGDIDDSWASLTTIINFYAQHQDRFASYAGPGHWNDPDMLLIGNFGLSIDQSKAQMALWAIFASPLIMSNDLRSIRSEFRDILTNRDAIAINQDALGIQGRRVYTKNKIDIFTKPMLPTMGANHSYAVAILSQRTDGSPYKIVVSLSEIGLTNKGGYLVKNVFDGNAEVRLLKASDTITVRVNPTGVVLLRAEAIGNL